MCAFGINFVTSAPICRKWSSIWFKFSYSTVMITTFGVSWGFYVFIRICLLARRNLLWDILRFPSSRRAALGLYVVLTLWRARGANQPPYALLHRSSPRYALRHGRQWQYFDQTFTKWNHLAPSNEWLVDCPMSQDSLFQKSCVSATGDAFDEGGVGN